MLDRTRPCTRVKSLGSRAHGDLKLESIYLNTQRISAVDKMLSIAAALRDLADKKNSWRAQM